jgi:hypothetical protein
MKKKRKLIPDPEKKQLSDSMYLAMMYSVANRLQTTIEYGIEFEIERMREEIAASRKRNKSK